MEIPLDITFQDIPHSEAVETKIRDEAAKLEGLHDRITSCRVVVARPHQHHQKGNLYEVKLHLTIPGGAEIVVSRDPGLDHSHEDVFVAIRDAFRAARRQVHDQTEKRRGH